MTIDKYVMAFAGLMILFSLVMSQYHSINWLWFTAFVGFNVFQSGLTGFCPLAMILKKVGIKPGVAFS